MPLRCARTCLEYPGLRARVSGWRQGPVREDVNADLTAPVAGITRARDGAIPDGDARDDLHRRPPRGGLRGAAGVGVTS